VSSSRLSLLCEIWLIIMAIFSLYFLCLLPLIWVVVLATAVPSHMTAVIQTTKHGPLSIATDVPTPTPRDNEALIRVHYSALNRMDLLQAKGKYPLPEGTSDILGVEVTTTINKNMHHTHNMIVAYACMLRT
jgi:hypothetical protein